MSETIVPIRRALISVYDKRGPDRSGAGTRGQRHRAPGQRRQPVSARRCRSRSDRSRRLHRSARDLRRPGQDACTPRSTAEFSLDVTTPKTWRRSSAGLLADRPGRRQPLSIRGHRRAARRDLGRGDRKHRHRRARAHPRGRQEPRSRRRLDQPRPIRRLDRRHPRHREGPVWKNDASSRWRRSGRPVCTIRRSPITWTGSRAQPATEASAFPQRLDLHFDLRQPLRYGENPHQKAAFYVEPAARRNNLATAKLRHGKELSYNNLLDLDSALRLVRQFAEPAACILKHNNPCGGRRSHADAAGAFEARLRGRPGQRVRRHRGFEPACRSRHGRANVPARPISGSGAGPWLRRRRPRMASHQAKLAQQRPPARSRSSDRSRRRRRLPGLDFRRIEGGLLVQSWDRLEPDPDIGKRRDPARRRPRPSVRDLAFAWRVCASVKSNAIVLAKDGQVVGVGAGQMSRLDSVRIASRKPVREPRARSWRPMPFSRSATVPTWRPPPA